MRKLLFTYVTLNGKRQNPNYSSSKSTNPDYNPRLRFEEGISDPHSESYLSIAVEIDNALNESEARLTHEFEKTVKILSQGIYDKLDILKNPIISPEVNRTTPPARNQVYLENQVYLVPHQKKILPQVLRN